MKLLAAPAAAIAAALVMFPAMFATGDNPGLACAAGADVAPILATIRTLESGGNYTARARGSSASGAYQFIDSSWGNYLGYPQAWQAPPEVQDAKAAETVRGVLDAHDGDVTAVPVAWYIGRVPPAGSADWDRVPVPEAGNRLTPREYQTRWLAEYDRQLAPADPTKVASAAPLAIACAPGAGITPLVDGFTYPGPADLFAVAPVDAPHHDYPAWDWMIPTGTPIYAVRGGRVAAVQYWPYNWWDHGCGQNPAGCHTCGIGVTIEDDTGNRWAYCHGTNVHVTAGTTITAGTQILTSGNTGRSGGPHLHLQIRTPDNLLRCPQQLLRSLRDHNLGVDPNTLATTGCYW
ncbi:MAG TPA: peptidoglycan DD-metalloendopeptidase family protein [Ilumatobacter sp.]|nr:peptidoglycan DD-metalloendopeptidase family protein [Ilumatobacter sp.]